MPFRRCFVAHPPLDHGEVVVRFRPIGRRRDRLGEGVARLFDAAARRLQQPQPVPDVRIGGRGVKSLLERSACLVRTALPLGDGGQVDEHVRMPESGRQCSPIVRASEIELTCPEARIPEIFHRQPVGRIERECALEEWARRRGIAFDAIDAVLDLRPDVYTILGIDGARRRRRCRGAGHVPEGAQPLRRFSSGGRARLARAPTPPAARAAIRRRARHARRPGSAARRDRPEGRRARDAAPRCTSIGACERPAAGSSRAARSDSRTRRTPVDRDRRRLRRPAAADSVRRRLEDWRLPWPRSSARDRRLRPAPRRRAPGPKATSPGAGRGPSRRTETCHGSARRVRRATHRDRPRRSRRRPRAGRAARAVRRADRVPRRCRRSLRRRETRRTSSQRVAAAYTESAGRTGAARRTPAASVGRRSTPSRR